LNFSFIYATPAFGVYNFSVDVVSQTGQRLQPIGISLLESCANEESTDPRVPVCFRVGDLEKLYKIQHYIFSFEFRIHYSVYVVRLFYYSFLIGTTCGFSEQK